LAGRPVLDDRESAVRFPLLPHNLCRYPLFVKDESPEKRLFFAIIPMKSARLCKGPFSGLHSSGTRGIFLFGQMRGSQTKLRPADGLQDGAPARARKPGPPHFELFFRTQTNFIFHKKRKASP